jgi:hypothetical protein
MSRRENANNGRTEEFFVAYTLQKLGLLTVHVDLPFDDLWCLNPTTTEMFRVQVKSCAKPYRRPDCKPTTLYYSFGIPHRKKYKGVFIFVAADIHHCIARSWDDVPPRLVKTRTIKFTEDEQASSIKREFKL